MCRCVRGCVSGGTGGRNVAAPEDRTGAHRETFQELIHAFQSDFSRASIKHVVRSKEENPPPALRSSFPGRQFLPTAKENFLTVGYPTGSESQHYLPKQGASRLCRTPGGGVTQLPASGEGVGLLTSKVWSSSASMILFDVEVSTLNGRIRLFRSKWAFRGGEGEDSENAIVAHLSLPWDPGCSHGHHDPWALLAARGGRGSSQGSKEPVVTS